jgi:hypothetical protein
MANWFESIGYGLGKLHTGMLCYLCDLYTEGVSKPLEAVLSSFGLRPPKKISYAREWDSIDLAIFDELQQSPWILIETKVDDHEHETSRELGGFQRNGYQTVVYHDAHPDCEAYIFMTLGMGEYYHAPYGSRFKWVRIREFLNALNQITTSDPVIGQWREAVRAECLRQDKVLAEDSGDPKGYRTGS